jgi:filamentous hemagglutinin family protein
MPASKQRLRRGRLATALSLALVATAGTAHAGDGTVVAGNAAIARDAAGNTSIVQGSDRAIIDWNDFSVGAGQWMRFLQPGVDSAVLNRVLGGDPSRILGELSGNGWIFVINPNGLVVGPDGVIQAGAFTASTLDVDNAAFMGGGALRFSGDSAAAIRNLGFIRAASGDVVLVARSVGNDGTIEATQGTAAMAAGNDVMLQPVGDQRVVVQAGIAGGGPGVDNAGTIRAAQAQLAAAGGNVYALAINAGGSIEATGLSAVDGRIVLTSDGGDITVAGTLRARDADGSGGTILVGGDAHGASPEAANAGKVSVAAGALLDADSAADGGDGGKVVVWSDGDTAFDGSILARGGGNGGDGGFAEVSGRRLAMNGVADLRAPQGTAGTLLLDPDDIVIDTDAAANGSAGGTTTLTDEWINGQLALGALVVQTDASASGGNGDITFRGSNPFATAMPNALTFDAMRNIVFDTGFNLVATLEGADGAGGFLLATLGDLSFQAGNDIVLDQAFGVSYTVAGGDGTDDAPGDGQAVQLTPGRIVFDAGNDLAINAGLSISVNAAAGAGGSALGSSMTGGAGGDAIVWAGPGFSFDAGNDVNVAAGATIGKHAIALGGTGGAAGNGGTAGRGGIATAAVRQFDFNAGNRFVLASGAGLEAGADGTTGASGEGDSIGMGGTGGAGNATAGGFRIDALYAGLSGDIHLAGVSTGGDGAQSGTNGAVGGFVGPGGLAVFTTGSMLLGGTWASELLEQPGMDGFGPFGGSGGAGGNASGGSFEFHADGDIGSAAGGLRIDAADYIILEAGHSVLLDNSALSDGSTSIPLLLVADNANATRPDAGDGAVRLVDTTLDGAAGVSIWGVSNALVDLGGWTPSGYGLTDEWRGEGGNWMGLGVHCKFICTAPPVVSPLTITADDKDMTYGAGAFPAFTARYSGFLGTDDASLVSGLQFSTTATLGSNVGTYVIHTCGASESGYAISYVDGVLTINPAPLVVRANDASRGYNMPDPAFGVTTAGLVNGDTDAGVYTANPTTTAAIGSNVGTYAIAPNAVLLSGNYVLDQVDGMLTISAAPLTIAADDKSMLYGAGLFPAFTASYSGFLGTDDASLVSGLQFSTTATLGSNVGTYVIHPFGASAPGYAIGYVDGMLAINAAALAITADDKSVTYGAGAFPGFTASYSGFLAGDDAGDVSGLQFSTTASLGANAGSYAIHPFGASAPGYEITYVDGVLTITPAALTVGVADASRNYGQKNPRFVLQVAGLVNGDSAGEVFSASPASTATIGSNVGTYAIAPNATLLGGNYVLAQLDGMLTILPAELLVSLVAGDVVRGDAPQKPVSTSIVAQGGSASGTSTYSSQFGTTDTFRWLVSGIAAGDTAPSGAPAITGDGMQSAYAIAAGSLAASPNYVFRFAQPTVTGWLTVHNPQLTVSIADLYAMTQGLDISPRYVFTGFRGSDGQWENLDLHDDRFGWTTTAQSGGEGGDYPIMPNGPEAFAPRGGAYGPYDVAYNGGTLHVLNKDGNLARSASCTGKGCGATVSIQLLVENGSPRRQALYNFAMVPKIFGLPANFTRQLNDIVGMYLRSIGQAGDAASASNWLLANASNPDAYGQVLPFVLQWMQTYEREAFLQRVLSDAEKYLTGDQRYADVWQSLTPYLTGMEIGSLAYRSPDALRAVVARLRGEHPAPTEADLALYDYIATDLQNKRIAAADAAVQAYKQWKAESAKKKEEKLPTLLGLFDLGESPPQELMTAARTGASPEGADPEVMAHVLGAAAASWAGASVGGLTGANITTISTGIASAISRGATLTTSMVGGAAAGPAIIVTAALQIAVQGIIKVVSDAEFEKKLYEAADNARRNWSVTSLMNTDEKTGGSAEMAIGTATNLAALLAGGTTEGAVSTVSTHVDPLPGGGFLIVEPVPTIDPSQIVTLPSNIIMQGDDQ